MKVERPHSPDYNTSWGSGKWGTLPPDSWLRYRTILVAGESNTFIYLIKLYLLLIFESLQGRLM